MRSLRRLILHRLSLVVVILPDLLTVAWEFSRQPGLESEPGLVPFRGGSARSGTC